MRKTLLLLVLIGIPSGAAVSAAAPPNSVTIALSRPAVVYGGTVTLSGAVSNHKSGEKVTLLAEPFPASSSNALIAI